MPPTADHDLNRPLPHHVLAGGLGPWSLYQTYPTFSWPWWRQRSLVFGSVAVLFGFAYAAWHSAGMGVWGDWPGLALRASSAAVIAVIAGPLFGTIVRNWRLPYAAERILIVLAVAMGIWIGIIANDWIEAYHRHIMDGYLGRTMDVPGIGRIVSIIAGFSIRTLTLVLVFAGGGLAIFYYLTEPRRLTNFAALRDLDTMRAHRDAADMRLAILQAQVEPHFLFNTLASVRSLIASEPERAAQTVDALSDYLRATLPRLRETGIEDATLDRQIDICTRYLDLMNVRMAGRIRVTVSAPAETRALPFPPLILLTLVENAVTHGIEPKPGPGAIIIRARLLGDDLEVAVEDDGAGLEPGAVQGVGLANVRAHLRNRFGDRASLEIEGRPEGGACATIRIRAPAR